MITALPTTVVPSAATANESVDVGLEWWDITATMLTSRDAPLGVDNYRAWALTWLASARAVNRDPSHGPARDYQTAAFVGAVHESLVTFVPARRAELDQALATTLSRIPDGPAESQGLATGRSEVHGVLAERQGDGLDNRSVFAPFTPPPPAPGIWRPTPPNYQSAYLAGLRNARPFALNSNDQFRPGPPPALGSDRYRADWVEVRDYGSANSTVRTAEQTGIATFFYTDGLPVYHPAVRAALRELTGALDRQAEFLAVFHMGIVDALIAVWEAKFHYLSWRPITAIREADTDGDPATSPDPTWSPLHMTPAHPDYVSGHAGFAAAMVAALTAFTGAGPDAPVTLTNPNTPGVTRTYTYWYQLDQEMINARVWSGIHTRTAAVVGVVVGTQAVAHMVRQSDRLFG